MPDLHRLERTPAAPRRPAGGGFAAKTFRPALGRAAPGDAIIENHRRRPPGLLRAFSHREGFVNPPKPPVSLLPLAVGVQDDETKQGLCGLSAASAWRRWGKARRRCRQGG